MKALSAFYDMLMPQLKGITTQFLDAELVLLSREFCATSSAWRADFDPVNLVAGEAEYDLDPSESQSETVRVLRLTVNDELLWDQNWNKSKQDEVAPKYEIGAPPFTVADDLLSLTLLANEVPTANVTGGLLVVGAMKPQVNATQLPDILLTVHAEAIRAGTLARLMRMGSKPWTDRDLSSYYENQYQQKLQLAATNAQHGNTRGPLRTRKWW